ncbi:MAG: hypothetical protein IT428_03970 [Planctomycetaceae bacterium]|nr:hypothetical protein [Planctomycetaceae bacterium]
MSPLEPTATKEIGERAADRPLRLLPSLGLEIVCVWMLFFAYGALHAPPPATGEPHYLSKARHFYDPTWCQGDLFLESTDTHVVLYAAFGWLMLLVSPEATIWIGRGISTLLVASGWTLFARGIVRRRGSGLAAGSIHCGLESMVNLSGEWLLDGFEGRVLGYGMLFLAWGLGLHGRRLAAAAALGGAIAMHPVVGSWGALATLGGWLFCRLMPGRSNGAEAPSLPFGQRMASAALFLLTASAGVVPALRAVGGTDGPRADAIQVFYRLAHHLDPTTFDRHAWWAYAAMLTGWLLCRRWEVAPHPSAATSSATMKPPPPAAESRRGTESEGPSPGTARRWWLGCVLSSIVFFGSGVAIAWGPRPVTDENFPLRELRTRLLKFYPFRLADMLIPTAVALTATTLGFRLLASERHGPASEEHQRHPPLLAAAVGVTIAFALGNGWVQRVRPPIAPWRIAAWRDVCAWVKGNAPRETVFITPQVSWAFKWFAERPEYVSYKDCPQDPAGLVEWNRRLLLLDRWATDEFHDGFSVDALRKLRRLTGATHVLARDLGPFAVEPIYRNEVYQVIELPPDNGEDTRSEP